jgi:hypothetical protein
MRRSILLPLLAGGIFATSVAEAVPTRALRVESAPAGATVYLDAEGTKPLGITPIPSVKVAYGYHEFIFVLEGYETTKVPVNVNGRARKVSAQLAQQAKVMISAGSASATGADVVIDGKVRGQVPWQGYVPPGRHRVEISRVGFAPFADWVELAAGQILTLPVVLAEAQKKGTLFVTADVAQAQVFVDGKERGRTPLLVELPEGKAVVEVHAGGLPPWRNTVMVKAGDKTIVEAALRPNTGPSGTALIISNVSGTLVWVDGTKTGTAPVTLRGLAVGTHIVEGKAEGYAPVSTTVRVNQDEQTVVKLELTPAQAEYGRISVRASVPGAEVFVDGGTRGPAPVEMDQVPLGPHAIIVRAKGHADFEAQCEVKRNQTCSVMAAQTPLARIRVVSNADGARVTIDGKEMGPVPFEGNVSAEDHVIKVDAPHHVSREERMAFEASTDVRELQFNLQSSGTSPVELSEQKRIASEAKLSRYEGASHLSGVPPAPGKNRLHFSVGVPYMLEGGGTVGIIENVAVNVGFRLMQRDKNIGTADLLLGAHAGWRVIKPISLGVQLKGWAGTNMERVGNAASFGGLLKGLATLHFGDRAQFSLSVTGELFHDTWSTEDVIVEKDGTADRKQGGARLMAGGQLLFWVKEKFAIWGSVDGVAVGPERDYFQKAYFDALKVDPLVYFHAGIEVGF